MKKSFFVTGLLLAFIITIQSCKKDKTDPDSDNRLFEELSSGTYSDYQGGIILSAASPSPHGSFKLRFNATATSALDTTGEIPSGNSFPSGSVIVKDVYDGTTLKLHAVMKKDPGSTNSGSGWLWAEYNTDGSVIFSTGKKGDGCISCHSGSPNRDLTRTFDLH